MALEHIECTASDGSTLEVDDSGLVNLEGEQLIVLTIHDVSSFADGQHDARIELPLGQLRELFNEGFS